MRLAITGNFVGKRMTNGKFEPVGINITGKTLFVSILTTEHDEGRPKLTTMYLLDNAWRVLPEGSFFEALALPETCAKNRVGEVICLTNQKFYPAHQSRAAVLEMTNCPRCGNRLIVFEDAPLPDMVPKKPPA